MKIDLLAFAAHPDDVELAAGGTFLLHKALGYKTGIVDMTRGELGTRGTPETRQLESDDASKLMQLDARENLGFRDGFFEQNEEMLLKCIEAIRHYKPNILLANALQDRHPDHGRAALIVPRAAYLAGLRKIETFRDGAPQAVHRPKVILHYLQDYSFTPNVVLDITPFMEQKFDIIKAYKSQFYDPENKEPATPISGMDFLEFVRAKARDAGRYIGAEYGEGFHLQRPVGVTDLNNLF